MKAVDTRDLDWEAAQIDRGLDFTNVIFGALLSAYIGVELATRELTVPAMTNVTFILVNLTLAIYNYRVAWHILAKTIDGSIWWNVFPSLDVLWRWGRQ